jgi:hypothetical protein
MKFNLASQLALMAAAANRPDLRFDANETEFLERELTQLRTKIMEVQYADNLALTLVPRATDIAAYADTYSTPVIDRSGAAKAIGAVGRDIPRVDVKKQEILGKVLPIACAYAFDLFELQKAAATGTPLEEWKARTARRTIEDGIDIMVAKGETVSQTGLGVTGLVNNASVTVNTTALTVWASSDTSDALLAELAIPASLINVTVKNVGSLLPDTLALAPSMYDIIANKQVANTELTVLQFFLRNNPYIKNVVQWNRLATANAGGNGPRGIMYRRSPEVLEAVVPLLFQQLAPQAVGLELITNCVARAGGVKLYHPEAVLYLDHTG